MDFTFRKATNSLVVVIFRDRVAGAAQKWFPISEEVGESEMISLVSLRLLLWQALIMLASLPVS